MYCRRSWSHVGPSGEGGYHIGDSGAHGATGGVDERYEVEFDLSNFYECEQGPTEPIVRGRMKANIAFWREIGVPDEILGVIDSGYGIPFLFTPAPVVFKNNKSARDNPVFGTEAVLDLIKKILVSELFSVLEYDNPLSVLV